MAHIRTTRNAGMGCHKTGHSGRKRSYSAVGSLFLKHPKNDVPLMCCARLFPLPRSQANGQLTLRVTLESPLRQLVLQVSVGKWEKVACLFVFFYSRLGNVHINDQTPNTIAWIVFCCPSQLFYPRFKG